jgi:pyruvate kinase
MIDNQFPTRAETSDVFNSILQQPDCLMLSWETAIGKYPIDTVKMMVKVIKEAENFVEYKHKDYSNGWLREKDMEKKLLIKSGIYIWEEINSKALIILTKSWILARLAASFRPKIQVFAFTKYSKTVNYINSLFWITPIYLENRNSENFLETMDIAVEYLTTNKFIETWDRIIAINDMKKNNQELPIMEIINV